MARRARWTGLGFAALATVVLLAAGRTGFAAGPIEPEGSGARAEEPVLRNTDTRYSDLLKQDLLFESKFLDKPLRVLAGVFSPKEAEHRVLPFMRAHPSLFAGKRVLEIGTGSGIISLYAAQLGATKVVSTDINPLALKTAAANAETMGFDSVLETRRVGPDDMSAFAVIGSDEVFDVIISNPPYSLDLDSELNTAVTDRGDLGFSIVRGLEQHLAPDGTATLYYGSLFYHYLMVKFARHEGYAVRHHLPFMMTAIEAETLFNAYLDRLLDAEGLPRDTFRFDLQRDQGLRRLRVTRPGEVQALLRGTAGGWFPGMLVIER